MKTWKMLRVVEKLQNESGGHLVHITELLGLFSLLKDRQFCSIFALVMSEVNTPYKVLQQRNTNSTTVWPQQ